MNAILSNADAKLGSRPGRPARRPSIAQLLFFYTVPPLLMALPLGWYGAGLGAELPFAGSILLWTSICLMSWLLSDLCSRLFATILRPWHSPAWLILVCGYLLNLATSSVYNPAVVQALVDGGLAATTPSIARYFQVNRNLLDGGYLWMLFLRGIPGLLFWVIGNYLFDAMTGVRRFGRARRQFQAQRPVTSVAASQHALVPPDRASDSDELETAVQRPRPAVAAEPRFFERLVRLRELRIAELLAIEAEDHYIQVHSLRGKELIYYRFGDALAELQGLDGLQIHRSAWVSRGAITRLEGNGRRLQVVLHSGEKLRVSHSNRGALRAAGVVE